MQEPEPARRLASVEFFASLSGAKRREIPRKIVLRVLTAGLRAAETRFAGD